MSTSGFSEGSALPAVMWTAVTVPGAGALSENDWLREMVNCASTVSRSSVRRAVAVCNWGWSAWLLSEPRVTR